MAIVRYTAAEAKAKARVNRNLLKETSEKNIARYAEEDGTNPKGEDFVNALAEGRARKVMPLDVAAIRKKTGLSQERFAYAFQISPHTLRNWEQGRRVPEGPARALLLAIDRDPEAVTRALAA
ncbi:MAG: helix-turn-helix domain-containing protein [Alphaproteobacteria bacterium]|nr:helix-turn-helix domain-containing protein [Alphaproteobacteria bacterium]